MKVVVVDDERIVLNAETSAIKRVLPKAEIFSFRKAADVMLFAGENRIDIAFLDINIKGVTGLELAKKLQNINPRINIVFCTGYSEYSLDAHDLYCSAYLMKPVTDEKLNQALNHLRFPLSEKIKGFRVHCFGSFEVYWDGAPLKFKNNKTKELFAYLIDRQGSTVSTKDIVSALYENEDKESYVRNLRADLNNTFESLGLSDVLVRSGGNIGVNVERIDCDYFDYLDGQKNLFLGEYMAQYSFAEKTLGMLLSEKMSKRTVPGDNKRKVVKENRPR